MNYIYKHLIITVISFTCLGVFVATSIAAILDLFNKLKLAPDIRKLLQKVLLVEIVCICVAAFAGFLNPNLIINKFISEKGQLDKQIIDATKVIKFGRVDQTKHVRELPAEDIVVSFPWVDTSTAPGKTVAAGPYLHALGISNDDMRPPASQMVIVNNLALYAGQAVRPTMGSQNILTQVNTNNELASFTLKFKETFSSVKFTRPALFPATKSGITHPAWSAYALDANGRELDSCSEGLTRSFKDVPAGTYTLSTPGYEKIAAIRFDSDPRLNGKPFAAFGAVLIEQLTMMRNK